MGRGVKSRTKFAAALLIGKSVFLAAHRLAALAKKAGVPARSSKLVESFQFRAGVKIDSLDLLADSDWAISESGDCKWGVRLQTERPGFREVRWLYRLTQPV